MTLQDLRDKIDELSEYNPEVLEKPVMIEYNYGDMNHTRALADVYNLFICRSISTAYSPSGLAAYEDEDDMDGVVVTIG